VRWILRYPAQKLLVSIRQRQRVDGGLLRIHHHQDMTSIFKIANIALIWRPEGLDEITFRALVIANCRDKTE